MKIVVKSNKIQKSSIQRGGMKSGHKYIKRTGSPGHYRYWYYDSNGKLYSGNNAPNDHEHFDPKKPLHDYNPKQENYDEAKEIPPTNKIIVQTNQTKPQATAKQSTQPKTPAASTQKQEDNLMMGLMNDVEALTSKVESVSPYPSKDHNKHLAKVANQVMDAFISKKPNFTPIEEGVQGKKGLVEVDGKKYFIKDMFAEQTQMFMNLSGQETLYNDIVYEHFPDISNNYPSKLGTHTGMFIADAIEFDSLSKSEKFYRMKNLVPKTLANPRDIEISARSNQVSKKTIRQLINDDLHNIDSKELDKMFNNSHTDSDIKRMLNTRNSKRLEEQCKDPKKALEVTKLGILNYILGNPDRHPSNWTIDKTGQMKLFDEGLSFMSPQDAFKVGNIVRPNYMFAVFNNNVELDKSVLKNYFTEDKKQAILESMREKGLEGHKVSALEQRWDKLQKVIDKQDKVNIYKLFDDINR